jgi:HD-like signal output (HDOD) protein
MSVTQTPTRQPNIAFDFVRSLALELSDQKIELPSFPEIAVRVRRLLSDSNSTIDQVVRVVGSEPSLSARLIRIANSASFNRSGRHIGELRTAITRIGYNMVRSAAMSYAMGQIRLANKLAGLEPHLRDLWQRSTVAAAFAYVLARRSAVVNPDEALLGGMMHGIGKLYVLTRAAQHPELFADGGTLEGIITDWHASIGQAILENWDFSDEMAQAVGQQHEYSRESADAPPDLRDVICVAVVLAEQRENLAGLAALLADLAAAKRLGLDELSTPGVIEECDEEIDALTEALA